MIGGAGRPARLYIDGDLFALISETPSRENVVEPPSLVLFERTGAKIVPECKLLLVRVEVAKYIDEAPRDRVFIRVANALMKAHVPEMLLRTVNIDGFGRPQCEARGE